MSTHNRVETVRARFAPQLHELRRAFLNVTPHLDDTPDACYSVLAEAEDVYESTLDKDEFSRVFLWLQAAFGSVEDPYIPERGKRLLGVVGQLEVSVEALAEENASPEQLTAVEAWIAELRELADRLAPSNPPSPVPTSAPRSDPPPAPGASNSPAATPRGKSTARRAKTPTSSPRKARKTRPVTVILSPQAARRVENFYRRKAVVLKQTKLTSFPLLSREEQARRERMRKEERARQCEARQAAEEEKAAIRKDQRRAAARERQRLHRARVKAQLSQAQRQLAAQKTVQRLRQGRTVKFFTTGAAAATASHRPSRKRGPKAKVRPPKRKKATWARKELFPYYETAARAVGFSQPSEIVRYIRLKDVTGKFNGLRPDVLRKWIATGLDGKLGWSAKFLARVEADGANAKAGRKRVVMKYRDVFEPAFAQLRVTRAAHASISVAVTRAILIAHARRSGISELADCTFSKHMVYDILHSELGWSIRSSTRAAQKLPAEWEKLCLQLHARLTHEIRINNIKHPSLLVNGDQAGLLLMPSGKKTWAERGAKQVTVHGHDEKRQMTLMVSSSCAGDLVPFQTVWGGKRADSLPSPLAEGWDDAQALGFKHTHGDTRHWSSRDSMKEWIEEIVVPYHHRVCEQHGFPLDERMLLLIDVWPVHIAKGAATDFLPWLKRTYPWIGIYFVPGGCTGVFQPADVGLQRVIKHVFKTSATDWVIATVTRQLAAGVPPTDIEIPTSLPVLRDACIAWAVNAFKHVAARPELVRQAWAKCTVGDLNLSWDSLNSPAALTNYAQQLKDPEFASQFASTDVPIPLPRDMPELPEETICFGGEDDDTALSADVLANAIFGFGVDTECVRDDSGDFRRIDGLHEEDATPDDYGSDADESTCEAESADGDGDGVESDGTGTPSEVEDGDTDIAALEDHEQEETLWDVEHNNDVLMWDAHHQNEESNPDHAPQPPAEDITMYDFANDDDLYTHSTQHAAESDTESEEEEPLAVIVAAKAAAEDRKQIQGAPSLPPSAENTHIALDIAVIGGTVRAALEGPPTDAQRKAAAKAHARATGKSVPKNSKKKDARQAASGAAAGTKRKRRSAGARRASPEPHDPDGNGTQKRSMPARSVKKAVNYDEGSEAEDGGAARAKRVRCV